MSDLSPVPLERIDSSILLVRGQKVLLDYQLAFLYHVDIGQLNRSVKRNIERFPEDFMFQLNEKENDFILKCQIGISSDRKSHKSLADQSNLKCQIGTTSLFTGRWGGRRTFPYAFTEQGVAMLSGILRSPRAIAVNIEIMRSFVRLRQLVASSAELARKLNALEKKYDTQFKAVFDAIRELMSPVTPAQKKREIGFHATLKTTRKTTSKKR